MNKKGDLGTIIFIIFVIVAVILSIIIVIHFDGMRECCVSHGYTGYLSIRDNNKNFDTCYVEAGWDNHTGKYDRIYVPYVDVCGDS